MRCRLGSGHPCPDGAPAHGRGAFQPFSVLYLVHIALAAVVLGARWTWFLSGLSIGCYGLLFISNVPVAHGGHGDGASAPTSKACGSRSRWRPS